MITYREAGNGRLGVYLEGKRVGIITKNGNLYRYLPMGLKKHAGKSYPTIKEVKDSLE